MRSICLVVGVCFGRLLFGQAEGGLISVSGTVLDVQGRGISAAHLSLIRQPSSNAAETLSDSSGHFSFRNVKSGQYRLVVSANGFKDLTRSVDMAQDANNELTLTLEIAPVQTTVNVQSERGSITVSSSDTGSLTPVSPMDLPQSVQVVNRELLDEQQVFQYADALSYLAGVQRASTNIAGGVGNEVSMRGFILNTNNSYLRDGYKFFGVEKSDTADIEEVEVLKGPASALYGASEPGGVVNLISKIPTNTPYISLSMTGGSYTFLRPEFDISGPLNHSNTLFYRLNGVYEDTDSFRQSVHSRKEFIAPYLLWKPNSATSLAVLGEFINGDRNSDYGIPMLGDRPAPVPVSTNYAEPWNHEEDRDRQFGYRLNHEFHSGWNLYNGFELSRFNARYLDVYTTGGDPTNPLLLERLSDGLYFPYLYRFSRTNLTGSVKTGAVTHHIAAGFEAGWVTASSLGAGGYAPPVSILNPQIGTDFTEAQAAAALANPYFELTYTTLYQNQSFYAQDQVDLGRHWKAIVGVRAERYFQDSINDATNTHQTQTDHPVSPRLGLVYQPHSWLAFYGSFIKAFVPTSPSSVNTSGKQFQPESDHQWEAGVKATSTSGCIGSTVAFFQIIKNNVLAPDPNNSLFYVENGQERSKGAEFEFRGSPIRGLNLLTSYAFTQAQVTKSNQYPVGNILPNAPRDSGAVWASYQAPSGKFRNLGLSAGVVATTARYDNFYQLANPGAFPGQSTGGALLPGYARLDVGTFYNFHLGEKQRLRFSANIQNALDRVYYLASNGLDEVRPGSPIAVLVSLRWTRQ
jgi:iron complex outermembrane receptor protein